MGYDTYHWGELELNKEPDETVKKHFFPRTNVGYCSDDLVDKYGLWFLIHSKDTTVASRYYLERAQCTRHSDPDEGLQELIDNLFAPNGIVLEGSIEWQGEESDDRGIVNVTNNRITIYYGYTVYLDNDGKPSSESAKFVAEAYNKIGSSKEEISDARQ